MPKSHVDTTGQLSEGVRRLRAVEVLNLAAQARGYRPGEFDPLNPPHWADLSIKLEAEIGDRWPPKGDRRSDDVFWASVRVERFRKLTPFDLFRTLCLFAKEPKFERKGNPPPPGEWSDSMPLKEIGARLGGLTPRTVKRNYEVYGINRQSYQIRLDTLDAATRRKVEHGRA
jgi:hypothetical protein